MLHIKWVCRWGLLLFFAGAMLRPQAWAQTTTSQRQFDAKKIATYRQDKQYQYEKPPQQARTERWWESFWDWLMRLLLRQTLENITWVDRLIQVFCVVVMVFAIYRLSTMSGLSIFYNSPKSLNIQSGILTEDLSQTDLDLRIRQAIEARQYREAVRFAFYQLLQRLTQARLIQWAADKTNRDYQKALAKTPLQAPFGQLAKHFEYIYYGNFDIDQADFQAIYAQYQAFLQQINTYKPEPKPNAAAKLKQIA